ncbi:MAG: BREX-1 system adenine-specific DNA-methyltransferase PglX [Spirochaetia bacterium]|nr:BREX-1 system adenine-specific DNA-methyltransferase PglX [Spirochaetia bacterium]
MDKNAIKKYAVWARRELIARVAQKALQYGITEKDEPDPKAVSINGKLLSGTEIKQRQALIIKIKEQGYKETIEEVAYTWFNRFAALRFMEVNDYLPTHIRVFTNEDGKFNPQILSEAIHLDIPGLDMDKVYALKNSDKTDELFKYLLITQCNALNALLPEMFEKIADYTDLLLPDYLLREGNVIEQMVSQIPEEDWKDQVQIIGWLYQYYTSEKKDAVFEAMKKNIKVSKESIAAATQLFTPDWIVRYMVENSLGRLWLEGHNNTEIRSGWKYYLDEAEQTQEVQAQLAEIRKGRKDLNLDQIRFIDPCMGSGHILVYAFDVLMQIYLSCGYAEKDAAQCIVRNNIWGLDLDKRAYQLAYFAVMMKARRYDRRFLNRGIKPNLSYFQDLPVVNYSILDEPIRSFVCQFENADTYGSLASVHTVKGIEKALKDFNGTLEISTDQMEHMNLLYRILAQKYDVVCTNPPYLSSKNVNDKLASFLQRKYNNTKYDLYSAFIEKGMNLSKETGYLVMITQHSWMSGSRYEKARKIFLSHSIINMVHLGARAFDEIGGEVVQTVSFLFGKNYPVEYKGKYIRLTELNGELEKERSFLAHKNIYVQSTNIFKLIPSCIICYWISTKAVRILLTKESIEKGIFFRQGMATSDNDRFIREWYEVNIGRIGFNITNRESAQKSKLKWFPYNKGGSFRKWYGNNELVVNWENDGAEMKLFTSKLPQGTDVRLKSKEYYFKSGFTWSALANSVSVRFCTHGFIFDTKGSMGFPYNNKLIKYFTGLINSSVADLFLKVLAPTLDFNLISMKQIPMIIDRIDCVNTFVERCIHISKSDWDAFETSWDFKSHPLMKYRNSTPEERIIASQYGSSVLPPVIYAFDQWMFECEERFNQLKANEEELNRIFIDIYGLQDELSPEVEEKDVTVRKADFGRDIRSFISYAVGCMFGRYSLDVEGLAYAGGEWDASKFTTFQPDSDAIIPICDDEYFDDDIVGRFIKFVETVFGKETIEENLQGIADALGGKGTAREVIRKYFLNDFYADHVKIYQKRPIYWLFDSGKHNGFKCLVYMHRYRPDTIARIRTDYVHEQQSRYRTAKEDFVQRIINASTTERIKLSKRLNLLNDQIEEIKGYEEKIHHLADQMIAIDLDDGVKHNYELFKDVLAKIK